MKSVVNQLIFGIVPVKGDGTEMQGTYSAGMDIKRHPQVTNNRTEYPPETWRELFLANVDGLLRAHQCKYCVRMQKSQIKIVFCPKMSPVPD